MANAAAAVAGAGTGFAARSTENFHVYADRCDKSRRIIHWGVCSYTVDFALITGCGGVCGRAHKEHKRVGFA